ncbi:MAG TPA: hypothetical protein VE961_13140 [Pyrinomonadaceae bacterium]|nr:hypothetical protein [Pyrinomonadaceae bacterium]
MKALLVLPLLTFLLCPPVPQTSPADDSQVTVISFKWIKVHQTTVAAPNDKPLPARGVTQNDKNLERTARINDPVGVRDPNADTLDARGQELEKLSRTAGTATPKTTDAFVYQAKIHNTAKATIEIVFWEYQFIDAANPANLTKRQFLCGINLKPDKEKELEGFSSFGPAMIDAAAGSSHEKVIINRVEFSDGKAWMRKDWNAGEIRESYKRAMATPWLPNEMCRAL